MTVELAPLPQLTSDQVTPELAPPPATPEQPDPVMAELRELYPDDIVEKYDADNIKGFFGPPRYEKFWRAFMEVSVTVRHRDRTIIHLYEVDDNHKPFSKPTDATLGAIALSKPTRQRKYCYDPRGNILERFVG